MSEGRGRKFSRAEFVVYEAIMAGSSIEDACKQCDQQVLADSEELTWEQWFHQESRNLRTEGEDDRSGRDR
jgi:hypothetical protein